MTSAPPPRDHYQIYLGGLLLLQLHPTNPNPNQLASSLTREPSTLPHQASPSPQRRAPGWTQTTHVHSWADALVGDEGLTVRPGSGRSPRSIWFPLVTKVVPDPLIQPGNTGRNYAGVEARSCKNLPVGTQKTFLIYRLHFLSVQEGHGPAPATLASSQSCGPGPDTNLKAGKLVLLAFKKIRFFACIILEANKTP